MKIRSLDLDPMFKPTSHTQVKFDMFKFPGGEQHIKLKLTSTAYKDIDKVVITHRVRNGDDLVQIMIAMDACIGIGIDAFDLIMPYTPYARQDRVNVEGESFTLKVFATVINSMGFDKVYVFDAHSDVAPALIDRCINISNRDYVERAVKDILKSTEFSELYLVAPDYGASKKIHKLASDIEGVRGVIQCEKSRDVKTGKLSGFKAHLNGEEHNYPMLVVDDICDGGGSFIGLAEVLNCTALYLFVTHGIFSKGLDALKDYNHIYTTDSINTAGSGPGYTQYNVYV